MQILRYIIELLQSFVQSLERVWLLGLLLLLLVFYILPYFAVPIEDAQTALFPLLLICLWRLPKDSRWRLPLPLVGALGAVWAFSALQIYGFLPNSYASAGVFVSRLDDDAEGSLTKSFVQQYNTVARSYRQPVMRLLPRKMQSVVEAEQWLEKESEALMLLTGNAKWMTVVLPGKIPVIEQLIQASVKTTDDSAFRSTIAQYKLTLEDDVARVDFWDLGVPLVIVKSPESFDLPSTPLTLVAHYLAHFSAALEGGTQLQDQLSGRGLREFTADELPELKLASERDAFAVAGQFEGGWKTLGPLGVANFFIGTIDLLQANRAAPVFQLSDLYCSEQHFRTAAGLAFVNSYFEAHSAIFNNAAVAKILSARNARDMLKARSWFEAAVAEADQRGRYPRGARAALHNLRMLNRLGLFG